MSEGENKKDKKITLADEATALVERFDKEHKEVDEQVKNMAKWMANTRDLADNKHEIYRYRHELVSMKLDIATLSNIWNRRAIRAKAETYYAFKLGKKQIAPYATIAENHQILPKNDFERNLLADSSMRTMNYVLQMIENQFDFVKDSLADIVNMCYGMEYVIGLEEHISR